MKIKTTLLLIGILLLPIFQQNCFAQDEPDSVSTAIDSLLNKQYEKEIFVEGASKYAQSLEDAPASTVIITSKEIEAYGYKTLIDLLNKQAGFYISNDLNYNYLGVRGFSRPSDYNNRILLLMDGQRLNEYSGDGAPIGNDLAVNLEIIERVEIIRGPGSALYGTSAIFAIINLIPKKINDISDTQVNGSYGSFDTKRATLNTGHKFNNSIGLSLQGSYFNSNWNDVYFEEFDDLETNNGLSAGFNYEKYHSLLGSFVYDNFKLSGFTNSRTKGVPTAPWESDFNSFAETREEYQFIEASYFHNLSYNSQLSLKLFYNGYDYYSIFLFEKENWYEDQNSKALGGEVKFIWDILSNNRLTLGLAYTDIFENYYKEYVIDEIYTEFDGKYKSLAVYLQDEYQLNNQVSFVLGIRYDDYIGLSSAFTPRVGAIFNPWKQHSFKILYGSAFRYPSAYEREYESSDYGYKRNPSLREELVTTTEIVWDYEINKFLNSRISIYYYNADGLIDQTEDENDGFIHFVNDENVKAHGIEFQLNASLNSFTRGYFNYSFQHANNEEDQRLTNSPVHMFKIGAFTRIAAPLNISFEYQYESERITVYETTTDEIHLANLNLFTDPFLGKLKISMLINNIFDRTVKYPGGWEHVQPAIIQPERNYLLTISWGF